MRSCGLNSPVKREHPSPTFVAMEAQILSSGSRALHLTFDVLCAALGLLVLSPLLVAIALAVRLQNDGPVLYAQSRVGRNFRVFRVLKFRTMVQGADKSALLTAAADTRITPLGRILRKYKLDELPQLLNVTKGDMQLVGPRPEVARYVNLFPLQYALLLQDRPGITDPATIAYRHEDAMLTEHYAENEYVSKVLPAKLQISMEYQRRRTFISDLTVLMLTLVNVFR